MANGILKHVKILESILLELILKVIIN